MGDGYIGYYILQIHIILITSPSVSVASRPLFVRVRHYATQLTAASRPYPPRKITDN